MWHSVLNDIRHAIRGLWKSKAFTATAILCLSIGIGGTTAIFSIVNAVLLRPLPFEEPDRLVMLRSANPEKSLSNEGASALDFLDWQEQAKSFSGMAAYVWWRFDMMHDTSFERLRGFRVSDDFFSVLRLKPSWGQFFVQIGGAVDVQQVVLGYHVWQQQFRQSTDILDKPAKFNSWRRSHEVESHTIVGILPDGLRFLPATFRLVENGVNVDDRIDFCVPLNLTSTDGWRMYDNRTARYFGVIARLRDGISPAQAQAEMNAIAGRLRETYPDTNSGWQIDVMPLHDYTVAKARPALRLVFGAILCVLLIGCVNVAHLFLVRAGSRQKEFATRHALGASRWRLIRQQLTESLLLSLMAAGVGLLIVYWGWDIVAAFLPHQIPRIGEAGIDLKVLCFAFLLTSATGIAVGLVPALRAVTLNLNELLKSEGRTAGPGARRMLISKIFVITELALTMILLVASGLLMRSFSQVTSVDPGFEPRHRLSMKLSLPAAKYEWAHNSVFCHQVIDRLKSTPGIESAAAIAGLPMSKLDIPCDIEIEGKPVIHRADRPRVIIRVITDDYFQTLGIPLLGGRSFNAGDSVGEIGITKATIVNETAARHLWPGEDPINQRVRTNPDATADEDWITVIGVVGDVSDVGLDHEPSPEIYFPEKLFPQAEITLVAHTTADPLVFVETVRQAVHQIDPDTFISDVKTLGEVISDSLASRRSTMTLLTALAIVAVVLALTGIYGVTAYAVSQRRHEIGVRLAVGALPGDVVRLILRQGIVTIGFGLAIGLFASLLCARLFAVSLYGVPTSDWTIYCVTSIVLATNALAACYLAALRAARVDPMTALRHD